jgi:hypothetical protein
MFDVILTILAVTIVIRWFAKLEKSEFGSAMVKAFNEAHEEIEKEQNFDLVTWSPTSRK